MKTMQKAPRSGIAASSKGFTLVELLMVVAIIALLAALLLPSLRSAKEKGRAAACVNNLRQIGLAFQMYLDEWQGTYPAWLEGDYTWGQFVGHYEINGTPGPYAGCFARIYPYLGGRGKWRLFVCPSDPVKRDLRDTTSNSGNGTGASYGMNASCGDGPSGLGFIAWSGGNTSCGSPGNWVRQGNLQWPAETCVVADVIGWDTSASPFGLLYRPWSGWAPLYAPRHASGVNVLYCDGHVAWTPLSPNFTDPSLPAATTDVRRRFWFP